MTDPDNKIRFKLEKQHSPAVPEVGEIFTLGHDLEVFVRLNDAITGKFTSDGKVCVLEIHTWTVMRIPIDPLKVQFLKVQGVNEAGTIVLRPL